MHHTPLHQTWHSLPFALLMLYVWLCKSSPLLNASSNNEDIRCNVIGPSAEPIRTKDCLAAIVEMESEYSDSTYTMTHNPVQRQRPGMFFCPYVKHVGNCGLIVDFLDPSAHRFPRIVMTMYLELMAERLVNECVGRMGMDGGMIHFHHGVTWVSVLHLPPISQYAGTINGTELPRNARLSQTYQPLMDTS